MNNKTKKTALLGLLTATALILSYLESLIPPLTMIPGIKIGLPNIAIVLTMYLFNWQAALAVSLIRVLTVGLLFGGLGYTSLYSLAGALLSMLFMVILKYLHVPVVPVSIVGGIMHNVGQITVAIIVTNTPAIIAYLVPLGISGIVSGTVIGIAGGLLIKRLKAVAPDLFSKK